MSEIVRNKNGNLICFRDGKGHEIPAFEIRECLVKNIEELADILLMVDDVVLIVVDKLIDRMAIDFMIAKILNMENKEG